MFIEIFTWLHVPGMRKRKALTLFSASSQNFGVVMPHSARAHEPFLFKFNYAVGLNKGTPRWFRCRKRLVQHVPSFTKVLISLVLSRPPVILIHKHDGNN